MPGVGESQGDDDVVAICSLGVLEGVSSLLKLSASVSTDDVKGDADVSGVAVQINCVSSEDDLKILTALSSDSSMYKGPSQSIHTEMKLEVAKIYFMTLLKWIFQKVLISS